MDNIVRWYLWSSILIAILFFIFTSDVIYWVLNRASTAVYGPKLYSFSAGGPTLSGRVLMSILFFAVIFGIIDFVYTSLNGDPDEPTLV
jgi:hypothetical protein